MTVEACNLIGFAVCPDAWLSEILGKPALQVARANECSIRELPLKSEDLFVTAKLEAHQVADAAVLQDLGFRIIDAALTFEAPQLARQPPAPSVRYARAEDRAAVTRLAGTVFTCSRFHLDPTVPQWLAHRVKAAWAENFFEGRRGDGMVVAERDDAVVGFLQSLWSADRMLVIDLIAVAPQVARQGLAQEMIAFIAANGTGDGHRPSGLRVGTQAANTPSVRLYESLGFRLVKAQFVLHHHGRGVSYPASPRS